MTIIRAFVIWMVCSALLGMACAAEAQTMSAIALGTKRLSVTSANVDLARLRNELRDVLDLVNAMDGRGEPCAPTCDVDDETGCPCDTVTFDLMPSAQLLFELDAAPRQALLDFIRLAEQFCPDNRGDSDIEGLQECWKGVPDQLEALRKAAESLHAQAAGADERAKDETSRLVRVEGERAVAAVAALGEVWGKQVFLAADGQGQDTSGVESCGEANTHQEVPDELVSAINQMNQINTGSKLRRAASLFPELAPYVDTVLAVLASSASEEDPSRKPTAEQMNELCQFAAAVDARTNGRLANYFANTLSAGPLADAAQRIADLRSRVCRDQAPADAQGFCTPEVGDYAIVFSDYLRATFRTWYKADTFVKTAFPEIRTKIAVQISKDRAGLAARKEKPPTIPLSIVAANLMADLPNFGATAKETTTNSEVASDEGRSALVLLQQRLDKKKKQPDSSTAASCPPLDMSAVLANAQELADSLKEQIEDIDKATAAKDDKDHVIKTADAVRNALIDMARQGLDNIFPQETLAAIRLAEYQLNRIGDRLTIADLSDSGAGLVLTANLQSACRHDDRIDFEIAFSLTPRLEDAQTDVSNETVSGVPFSLPLRRSLLVSLEVSEFRSKLLAGDLETSLVAFVKQNIPTDFAADLSQLCALPAAIDPARAASSVPALCHWPTAIRLPAKAKITFDPDFTAANVELPDWLTGLLPDQCGQTLKIGNGSDSAQELMACFAADLKQNGQHQADVLSAMLGQQAAKFEAEARRGIETALPSLEAVLPKSVADLVNGTPSATACAIAVRTSLVEKSDFLENIRDSIAITDRRKTDTEGNPLPLPAKVPLLQVTAKLAIGDCLQSRSDIPKRLSGIWEGTVLEWSRSLDVVLPHFDLPTAAGQPHADPLDAWADAFEALRKGATPAIFVWEAPVSPRPDTLERNLAATLLAKSGHLELCATPGGGGEKLLFDFAALSRDDENAAPCTDLKSTASSAPVPALVLARGKDFRSLRIDSDLTNVVLGPIAGSLSSSLAVHLPKANLHLGTMPALSKEAQSCAASLPSDNRLAFDLQPGKPESENFYTLPLLHVLVGWTGDGSAEVALLADERIDSVSRTIGSVAALPADKIDVRGFVVDAGALHPCVVAPTKDEIAADFGAAFAQNLLSSDVASRLGAAARVASNVETLVKFISDSQPIADKDPAMQASDGLLLQLQACHGTSAGERFTNCDYKLAIPDCAARLRIDVSDAGKMTFDADRIALPVDCRPGALATIFGPSGDGDLPFTLVHPVLTIGAGNIGFAAQLGPLPEPSRSAAVNACIAKLDLTARPIGVAVNSRGAFSLSGGDDALKSLSQCALDYTLGAAADAFLPPTFEANLIKTRVNDAMSKWLETANKSMQATCDMLSSGPVACTPISIAAATESFPSFAGTSSSLCQTIAGPIDAALDAVLRGSGTAQQQCENVLSGAYCAEPDYRDICAANVGFLLTTEFDLPGSPRKARATAHFLPPDDFAIDTCFDAKALNFSTGYIDVAATPTCDPKARILGITGTVSLSDKFPVSLGSGDPPPISAPISLSADLGTGRASVDANGPNWKGVLSQVLKRAMVGKSFDISGSQVDVTDVSVSDDGIARLTGKLILDWGEHLELDGFSIEIDLTKITVPKLHLPDDFSAATKGMIERLASSVSIPGVMDVNMQPPVNDAAGHFKSVSAIVTMNAGVFTATLPKIILDRSGVSFDNPFSISLKFKEEIPVEPLVLTNIGGTISERSLSLSADATLGESLATYILKLTGDFTLPFDLHNDVTATEQMVAFSVVPLGKSTTTINVNKPLLSRTIDIGGALKPIIWLFGKADLDRSMLTGNTNLALFGVDLAKADLKADFESGLVSANGNADIGIGSLAFVFNGKKFVLDDRLDMNGQIGIGKFRLSGFNIHATQSSAATKFRVLGISLGFVVPSMKDITSDMLRKMIEKLFSFDLKDVGKALEAILSGNLTINPYSDFGKDQGNGVASGDGDGAEGASGEGGSGTQEENGGGAIGAVPAAEAAIADQEPTGKGAGPAKQKAADKADQQTAELKQKAKDAGPGASKPLLNPDGKETMQFSLSGSVGDARIVGGMLSEGSQNASPLVTLKKGDNSATYFASAAPPLLNIVKTPVLLEKNFFVASEASNVIFLPDGVRNQEDSPIKGLCSGEVSELDFLLFLENGDAGAPKRLPAGLMGLCLEGLKSLETKRPEARDLLLAALRTAAIALPDWQPGTVDTTKLEGPLKSAWFQCDVPSAKGTTTGLSMLISGELASRAILRNPDGTLRYFRMAGFPYGTAPDDAENRRKACLLLTTATPADEDQPAEIITFKDDQGAMVAGRLKHGEFRFDGSQWTALKTDDTHPQPPFVPSITPPDSKDIQIRRAIDQKNLESANPPPATSVGTRPSPPGGHRLCIVEADGQPWLVENDNVAPNKFMALRDNGVFDFTLGSGSKLSFPPLASPDDPTGCTLSTDPATLMAYDPNTPGVGRYTIQNGQCALEFYWQSGDRGIHRGFELSPSLCAAAQATSTDQIDFGHDMFWVIAHFMWCMEERPQDESKCLPDRLSVGGGWSANNRVVIATAPLREGDLRVNVWAGPITFATKPGVPLVARTKDALAALISRPWEPQEVDAFASWFQSNSHGLQLLDAGKDHLDFLSSGSSVLRINLSTHPVTKTEFDFISASGLDTPETIARLLDDVNVEGAPTRVNVALIADDAGSLTYALEQPHADGHFGGWTIWTNTTRLPATLAGLTSDDLVAGFGKGLTRLSDTAAEIGTTRNAKAVLLANGKDAYLVSRDQSACVEPLLSGTLDDADRTALIELWTKDFSSSLLGTSVKCDTAAVDTTPEMATVDGAQIKLFNYRPGVLDRLASSHALSADKAVTVVQQTAIGDRYLPARNRALAYAMANADAGGRLDLVGEIGDNKLRFAIDKPRNTSTAGLAGERFACPFDEAPIFSRTSVVLDAYLASIDQQCRQGETIFGADIRLDTISTFAGDVLDVVSVPDAGDGESWSVFFGNPFDRPSAVRFAHISFAPDEKPDDARADVVALARAWASPGAAFQTGGHFTVVHHGDGKDRISVAAGANGQSSVLAATDPGGVPPRFWPLGRTSDPFDGLTKDQQASAVELLNADLQSFAAGVQNDRRASTFCVVVAGRTLLWPELIAVSTTPYEQGYHPLGRGDSGVMVEVVSSAPIDCPSLEKTLDANYHEGQSLLLLLDAADGRAGEVWTAEEATPGETDYALSGVGCTLHSEADEIGTFAALGTRPRTLGCPERLVKRALAGDAVAATRLVMLAPDSLDSSRTTAWIESGASFKSISLFDPKAFYGPAHWALIRDGDLATDAGASALALVLDRSGHERLGVVTSDGTISVRQRIQPDVSVPTRRLPKNATNRAVRAALDTWRASNSDPLGIVFLPEGLGDGFWMIEARDRVGLFTDLRGRMVNYDVEIGDGGATSETLLSALDTVGEAVRNAISQRANPQFVARLRIDAAYLVLVGERQMVVQERTEPRPATQILSFDPSFGGLSGPKMPLLDRIVKALRQSPVICVGPKPCSLVGSDTRFAVIDGTSVRFGQARSDSFGGATISNAKAERIPALVSKALDAGESGQIAATGSALVPVGDEAGVLANGGTASALVFEGAQGRTFGLRATLAARPLAELGNVFVRSGTHVDQLMKTGGKPSIGVVGGNDALFACGDHSVTIFNGLDVGTVAADAGGIDPFCTAIESRPFEFGSLHALSMVQRHDAFVLFAEDNAGRFQVRLWGGEKEHSLSLPFTPRETTAPSLENDVRVAALDCDAVKKVVREGTGLALLGEPSPWTCSISIRGKGVRLEGPTLVVEHQRGDGGVVSASAAIQVTAADSDPKPGTGAVLDAVAARVAGSDSCPDAASISARVRSNAPLVLTADPDVSGQCPSLVGWRQGKNDPIQTFEGQAADIELFWKSLGSSNRGLAGTAYRLEAFVHNGGAVLSEISATANQNPVLTIVPVSIALPVVAHGAVTIRAAIEKTCSKNAIGQGCRDITPEDFARASVNALASPKDGGHGHPGGRRIVVGATGKTIIWPSDVWDFWKNIPNDLSAAPQ